MVFCSIAFSFSSNGTVLFLFHFSSFRKGNPFIHFIHISTCKGAHLFVTLKLFSVWRLSAVTANFGSLLPLFRLFILLCTLEQSFTLASVVSSAIACEPSWTNLHFASGEKQLRRETRHETKGKKKEKTVWWSRRKGDISERRKDGKIVYTPLLWRVNVNISSGAKRVRGNELAGIFEWRKIE